MGPYHVGVVAATPSDAHEDKFLDFFFLQTDFITMFLMSMSNTDNSLYLCSSQTHECLLSFFFFLWGDI